MRRHTDAPSAAEDTRPGRIDRLVQLMTWPDQPDRWRLDGELRRQTAPILGELVSAVGRLKAVLAGLADDARPVVLDQGSADATIAPSAELAAFRPGRVVALREVEDEEIRAATNPFAGLASRALDLLIPELEITLTELTVLLNEHLSHQEHQLEELLHATPTEVLTALEEAVPTWTDGEPARQVELGRMWRHLVHSARPHPERTHDDQATIRR